MQKNVLLAVLTALIKICSAHEAAQIVANNPPIPYPPFNLPAKSKLPPVAELRCGKAFKGLKCPGDMCCSHADYCGTTPDYCSVPGNCQEEYGWCDSMITPTGASVYDDKPGYNSEIPAVIRHCTKPKTLALSFDDGPSKYTTQVLDILRAHNAHATFFLGGIFNGRGQLDKDWAPVVQRIITDGHQIGSHTWSHPNLDVLSSAQRKDEMHKNERAIANVIGKIPTFMRAPMIKCNKDCQKNMKDMGYHVVDWQYDSEDWKVPRKSVEDILYNNLIPAMDKNGPEGNMFVVQHDILNSTAKLTDALLAHMHDTKDDWSAVPLVECLGHDLDDAFRYPKYLEYNGATRDGCLVSDRGLCEQAIAFKSKNGCKDAQKTHEQNWHTCKKTHKSTSAPCLQIEKLAADMDKFCNDCDNKHKPACDWDAFKADRM